MKPGPGVSSPAGTVGVAPGTVGSAVGVLVGITPVPITTLTVYRAASATVTLPFYRGIPGLF